MGAGFASRSFSEGRAQGSELRAQSSGFASRSFSEGWAQALPAEALAKAGRKAQRGEAFLNVTTIRIGLSNSLILFANSSSSRFFSGYFVILFLKSLLAR
jgi:hypothetical protein